MARLLAGPTNAAAARERERVGAAPRSSPTIAPSSRRLPQRSAHARSPQRWGSRESDPFFVDGALPPAAASASATSSSASSRRAATTSIRPRAITIPDLVPPHGYLAFYAWLRDEFARRCDRPSRQARQSRMAAGQGAGALARTAIPKRCSGRCRISIPSSSTIPARARRPSAAAAAVIIDHLTPPLTRAESYGPLRDLEALVDEYYEAARLDPRRCRDAARPHPRPGAAHRASPRIAASRATTTPTRRSASSTTISAS